jgi:hypothetical protein
VTGVGKKQPSDLWTRKRATAAYFPLEEQGRKAGVRAGAGGDAGAGGRPSAPGVEGDRKRPSPDKEKREEVPSVLRLALVSRRRKALCRRHLGGARLATGKPRPRRRRAESPPLPMPS